MRIWIAVSLGVVACGARSELLPAPSPEVHDAGHDAPADVVEDAPADSTDAAAPCPVQAWPVDLGNVQPIAADLLGCPVPTLEPPCPGLCGNGSLDACAGGAEDCEDTAGSETCQSLGYADGTLSCTDCRFDRSECDDCAPGGVVQACRHFGGVSVAGFAIAARPDRIVVASYLQGAGGSGVGAHVFWFDGWSSKLVTIPPGCLRASGIHGVELGRTPSGFLIAIDNTDGIDLFDVGGNLNGYRLAGAHNPRFASRPGAGPLLGFEIGEAQWAALLDVDGSVLWTTKVFDDTYTSTPYDAVFVGDAFLLAKRLVGPGASGGVRVARIEIDGRLTCVTQPGSAATEYPQLAWDGTRGRVTWADFTNAAVVKHAFIDAHAAASDVTTLSLTDYNPAPVLASGTGSLVLLGSGTGGVYLANGLTAERLDASGGVQSSDPFVDNPGNVTGYRLAPIDAHTAVAGWMRTSGGWGEGDGIGLALVKR